MSARVALRCVFFALLSLVGARAEALPRFAARTGGDCRLCHVSPGGGGMRNRYGAGVFQRHDLGMKLGGDAEDDDGFSFSPQLTEWLSIGTDLRTAYIYSAPDKSPVPGTPVDPTNTFLLMQADLYTAAQLGSHVQVALDVGVYTGFEAWALVKAAAHPSDFDLYLKVGRFMPSFGLRDANHDSYARQGVGLGAADRDTGVELTGIAGPVTLSVAVLNGTFGETAFDGHGTDHRGFEKAVASRLAVRMGTENFHLQLGGSFYWNDNVEKVNPLFRPSLAASIDPGVGVDEIRADAFLLAAYGRLSYTADAVFVSDQVTGKNGHLKGYAASQELGLVLFQGVELIGSFEFADPDIDLADDASIRVGGAAELFFGPYFELRAMARHAFSKNAATGDVTDLLVFAHAAF
ncbi:MAG: hypothetical protein U1E65_23120 [Myxococcota bacterium]